jgi:hypothetical protein
MNESDSEPSLFVWRDWVDERYETRAIWDSSLECAYCKTPLVTAAEGGVPPDQDFSIDTEWYRESACSLCGWAKRRWKSWHTELPSINSGRWATQKGLQKFSVADPRLAISELCTHLRTNFSDIYTISPRRFEELIAAVFKNLGWDVTLTKATRDGGVDMYLLQNSGMEKAIVECKRYRGKVGIGIVDRLLGVQLASGHDNAFLVTTSEFTDPAVKRAASPTLAAKGFKLSLVDAEQLTRHLGVFNEKLPPSYLKDKMNRMCD